MISEGNPRPRLEATLHVEGVRVSVEERVTLLRSPGARLRQVRILGGGFDLRGVT